MADTEALGGEDLGPLMPPPGLPDTRSIAAVEKCGGREDDEGEEWWANAAAIRSGRFSQNGGEQPSIGNEMSGSSNFSQDFATRYQELWQQQMWTDQMMWQAMAMNGSPGGPGAYGGGWWGHDNDWDWAYGGKGAGRSKRGGQRGGGDKMQDAQDSETQEQRELWDDLIVKMEAGDKDAVKEAMVIMRNKVFEFSRRKYGCRLVQKVIETASFAQQKEIANGLRGKVMRTVNHMHANYVMQKFVEQCPQTLTSFVSEEMYGHASQKAKDRSGCRVLLRLLEGSYGPETIILIDELVGHELTEPSPDSELGKLLMHDYAHHVIAKVLETGQAGQKELVLRCFKGDLWAFAKNHRSCYVLEFAVSKEMLFQDGTDEKARQVQEEILNMLVDKTKVREKGKERPLLVAMAMDPYGSYVVRAMLNRPDEFATKAATILRDDFQSLEDRGGKPGHRIIKEMQQLKQRLKDAKEDA